MTPRLLLDHPSITDFAFLKNGYSLPNPVVVCCEGAKLACHYNEVDPNGCTVVFFHGNGEAVSDYADVLSRVFGMVGCNTFLAEYRGYGDSTGEPSLGTLFADCTRILLQVPGDPRRLILFGRSMGCVQAAAAAGLVPNARGLILESGMDDVYKYVIQSLERRYRGSLGIELGCESDYEARARLRAEVDDHCNIAAGLARYRGPALVTYSLLDTSFRREACERLFSLLPEPKRLLRFDNADHNQALKQNLMTYCEQIREMVRGTFLGL